MKHLPTHAEDRIGLDSFHFEDQELNAELLYDGGDVTGYDWVSRGPMKLITAFGRGLSQVHKLRIRGMFWSVDTMRQVFFLYDTGAKGIEWRLNAQNVGSFQQVCTIEGLGGVLETPLGCTFDIHLVPQDTKGFIFKPF